MLSSKFPCLVLNCLNGKPSLTDSEEYTAGVKYVVELYVVMDQQRLYDAIGTRGPVCCWRIFYVADGLSQYFTNTL